MYGVDQILEKYVYYTTCSGCGLLWPHARYPSSRVGCVGDDSLNFIAMGIYVDRFGNTDDALLVGLRVYRLLCEKSSREDATRGTEGGDTDRFQHDGA